MAAEPQRQRDMSLVPYSFRDSREVVLRHNDAVVVYDPRSKQLVLRDTSQNSAVKLTTCPYCHQPLHGKDGGLDHGIPSPGVEAGFINPEYFRMLHRSIHTSPASSGQSSPTRQLRQSERLRSRSSGPSPGSAPGPDVLESSQESHASSQNIPSGAFSPDFYKKNFIEKGELGRGGNGVVLKVEHIMGGVSLGHFACKRIPVGDDQAWLRKVLMEVQLLQHLTHQNLVSYHYVWLEDCKLTNFGPNIPCIFILQQYCNSGDLQQYVCQPAPVATKEQLKERIRRRSKGDPEPPQDLNRVRQLGFDEIFSFFRDITSGLHHLHSNGYIHRDLKPSNCLLHNTVKGRKVLVSDFGEVQMENVARKSTGATGTVSYCAPEVLRRVKPDGEFGNFSTKSDIFSLGMILYFMCFGDLPYVNADNINEENEDLDQLRAEITSWSGFNDQQKLRPELPDELYKYLKKLLSTHPESRPTAEDILKGIGVGEEPRLSHSSHNTTPPSFAPDMDDLDSRISRLDTPSPATSAIGTPPTSDGRYSKSSRKASNSTALSRLNHPGWLRSNPFPSDRDRDQREQSPLAADRSTSASRVRSQSPNGHSLILRPPHLAPPSQSQCNSNTSKTLGSPSSLSSPLQLRAAPPPPTWLPHRLMASPTFRIIARLITSPYTLLLSKLAIFFFKIFSLTSPCTPMAASQWVVYPLLALAALDFGSGGGVEMSRVRRTALLVFLHVAVVGFVKWWDGLCVHQRERDVVWTTL